MLTWDVSLAWAALLLLAFGLVMVYSASIATAEASAHTGYHPWYFLVRHAMFLAIGLAAAFFAFQVPVKVWQCGRGMAVHRRRGPARAGADSRHRACGQRLAALAAVLRRQHPAVRVHEARGRHLRSKLRGAQGGVPACRATAAPDAVAGIRAALGGDGAGRRTAAAGTRLRRVCRHPRDRVRHPVSGGPRLAPVQRARRAASGCAGRDPARCAVPRAAVRRSSSTRGPIRCTAAISFRTR